MVQLPIQKTPNNLKIIIHKSLEIPLDIRAINMYIPAKIISINIYVL